MRSRRTQNRMSDDEIIRRHPKYSLNAIRIAHSDVDMRLGIEARTGIDWLALSEDRTYCFYGAALGLVNRMQVLDDGAIKLPAEAITICR